MNAYRQAIQLDPRLALAHYGIGRVYARLRRWQEAADELRTALQLDPTLGRAHYTLAQACRHLGQPAEAAAELRAFRRYRLLRSGYRKGEKPDPD
jgi:tetratricopeptide (TPR) repeat protein